MGRGWQQAKPQTFSPGTGAGGYYGQVTPSRGGDTVEGIQRGFNYLSQGLQYFTKQRADQERLAMEQEKFTQDMELAQQKLNLAKEGNQLAQLKYASAQKQQQFENEMKMKEDARKQVNTELKLADWKNKEEVSNIFRNNIQTITETLENGSYEDMLSSDEYQTMLAGLAAVDPEGAFKMTNDVLSKRAKELNNVKASATYKMTSDIYTSELPEAISMIESGKDITEAVEPIRQKISALAKTGNIDNKAMVDQLKSIMSLLKSYKKNSSSTPLQSFDAKGNPVDPMLNPKDVSRQVNPITGKITNINASGENPLQELIRQKLQDRKGN